ncbi:FimV/HubP family polar landmark protein [Thiorhodococcus minor]|uniref:FimV N-terminal domain-containing protein n=1 Tax=Thiorhodococcus minor TaxID=57489 RepID=A0A6M0K0B2_9GAMM|nr:FimV/HubP family polar landmark protein [Thiorhodococcus minor]NEV62373.1 hypothetical protein [Thiorhodococcus minor]
MSRKLILASTITMVLAGTDVSALGLGGLRPQSALNQPFAGEIELRDARPDELDAVSASLATQAAFSKAGIERYYYLTRLNFTPDVNAQGKPVIRVSSKDPIREPYMDFLVEVVWPSGKLLKEYTILLDPPALSQRASAPAVRTARASSAAAGSAGASVASASGRSSYIPAPGDGFPVYVGPVGNGNGLWVVARNTAPAGATVAQTAMALYRNNQGAFIRGNINRLIAGKTLVIPSRAELFALDPAEAEREYTAALRGRAQYRAPLTDVSQAMAASQLRVTGAAQPARAPAPTASAPAVQASTAATSPRVQQDVMLALETSESTRQETLELRDRIRELETQLADIQTLLQLRNAELARMQELKTAPGIIGEPRPETAQADVVPESVEAALESLEEAATAEAEAAAEETAVAAAQEESLDVTEAAEQALDAALAEEETAVEEEAASEEVGLIPVPTPTEPPVVEEVVEVAEAPVEPATPPTSTQPPTPAVEPQEETSTWHSLLLPLAGLAGLTAVGIMVFSWITMRRRREEEGDDDELAAEDERYDTLDVTTEPRSALTGDAETVAATSGADDEPMSEPESLQTNEGDGDSGVTMMSSLSNFDAETDEADVLSEADIYIAYGRYSEAQDLLKTELGRFPERLDIKYKLAESFAASRDLNSLSAIMDEIQSSGGDQQDPEQWGKLQSQLEQLQSSGGAVPVAPSPGTELSAGSEDSLDLGVEDSLSLDLSDVQRSSDGQDSSDLLGDFDIDEEEPPREKPEQAAANKPPIIDLGIGDSELGNDSFGDAMTVAVDQAENDQRYSSADTQDSEIELTLEEHKIEDVDELDSMFDTDAIDEPTLARDEMEGGRPKDGDLGILGQTTSGASESSDGGLPPDQESVPSDLLSSQWQIDSGIWDETATKLDLARAYIEMDDKEAAREILEEVMSEGRDEQKSEAKSMLDGLG